MSTLYEYYNTGDTDPLNVYGVNWEAQTFTVGATGHTVSSVKLKLAREGSPGTVTVSIRATDVDGHPTGDDLTSGTIDGDMLTTDTAGAWYEIALTEYALSASTKYAIVVRAPSGSQYQWVWWRYASPPTYAGGNWEYSSNSGGTWSTGTVDVMFEVWGPSLAHLYFRSS